MSVSAYNKFMNVAVVLFMGGAALGIALAVYLLLLAETTVNFQREETLNRQSSQDASYHGCGCCSDLMDSPSHWMPMPQLPEEAT